MIKQFVVRIIARLNNSTFWAHLPAPQFDRTVMEVPKESFGPYGPAYSSLSEGRQVWDYTLRALFSNFSRILYPFFRQHHDTI